MILKRLRRVCISSSLCKRWFHFDKYPVIGTDVDKHTNQFKVRPKTSATQIIALIKHLNAIFIIADKL
jgi:hypothetical protein